MFELFLLLRTLMSLTLRYYFYKNEQPNQNAIPTFHSPLLALSSKTKLGHASGVIFPHLFHRFHKKPLFESVARDQKKKERKKNWEETSLHLERHAMR